MPLNDHSASRISSPTTTSSHSTIGTFPDTARKASTNKLENQSFRVRLEFLKLNGFCCREALNQGLSQQVKIGVQELSPTIRKAASSHIEFES